MTTPRVDPQEAPAKRRPWLVAVVVAWIVVVAGLGWWSVAHDPPTVPEQRDIADALPVLQRATAAVLAASDGEDRAVRLGDLEVRDDCSVTPVRGGVEAERAVTVYVPAGGALAVLGSIARALPADYRAETGSSSGGRRVGLTADAGGFVAIDAAADATAQVVQVRVSTGCRPASADARLGQDAAPARDLPETLTAALTALRSTEQTARLRQIACPDGGFGRTYTVDGVPAPEDLGRALQPVVAGATVIRSDPAGWAYRVGSESVVVDKQDSTVRVSVTTACS